MSQIKNKFGPKKTPKKNKKILSTINDCIIKNDIVTLEILISEGQDINEIYETKFIKEIEDNITNSNVKWYLGAYKKLPPIFIVIFLKNIEYLEKLLNLNIDLFKEFSFDDSQYKHSISNFIYENDFIEILQYLIKYKYLTSCNIDIKKIIINDHIEIFKYFT